MAKKAKASGRKKSSAKHESVYKIIEIIGTSPKSWEDAAKAAIATAGKSLQDLRIAAVTGQDVTIENGKISSFRVKLSVSFKYHLG